MRNIQRVNLTKVAIIGASSARSRAEHPGLCVIVKSPPSQIRRPDWDLSPWPLNLGCKHPAIVPSRHTTSVILLLHSSFYWKWLFGCYNSSRFGSCLLALLINICILNLKLLRLCSRLYKGYYYDQWKMLLFLFQKVSNCSALGLKAEKFTSFRSPPLCFQIYYSLPLFLFAVWVNYYLVYHTRFILKLCALGVFVCENFFVAFPQLAVAFPFANPVHCLVLVLPA